MFGNQEGKTALKESASNQNSTAEYYLGRFYEQSEDWVKAQKYYQQAIARDNAFAMYRIGILYQQNRFSKTTNKWIIFANKSQELNWYRKAAVKGSKYALDALIVASDSEPEGAIHLAQIYLSQEGGIVRNMSQIVRYFQKASRLGSNEADFQLGLLYEQGKNFSLTTKYFLSAAKRGHNLALTNLQNLANHSRTSGLDYEIGQIFAEKKDWINALHWYTHAANQQHAQAAEKVNILIKNPEFIDCISQAYANSLLNIKQVCNLYVKAIKTQRELVKKHLLMLAEKGSSEAQYTLAFYYYHKQRDYLNAAHWCMRAAETNHQPAQDYLKKTSFSSVICISVAEKYETGDGVKSNLTLALEFYNRANNQGDKIAAFRLAQIFELSAEKIQQDLCKAFDFYILAAQRNHEQALLNLKAMLQKRPNAEMEFKLGAFYEQSNNYIEALHWYKKSADKKYLESHVALQRIVNKDGVLAFTIGNAYEKDINTQDHLQTAIAYYKIAFLQKYKEAAQKIYDFATAGNTEAQYVLGSVCYAAENNNAKIIYWCMKAAGNKHQQALHFLRTVSFDHVTYLSIAEHYEQGNHVSKNIALAIEFFTKAADTGNQDAAYHLGRIYEEGLEGISPNIQNAYRYYLVALRHGHPDALTPLNEIVKTQKVPQWEYELALAYDEVLNNKLEAFNWYKRAIADGQIQATTQLEKLSNKDREFAYMVAQEYDQEEVNPISRELALVHYAIAMRLGHEDASEHLLFAAEVGEKEAQYVLGYYCYHFLNDFSQATDWCMQAVEQGHEKAWKYLKEKPFNVELCVSIAEKYAYGTEDIKQNKTRAIVFYIKAREAGYMRANIYLGQLYETEELGRKKNLEAACECYLYAVENGFEEALAPLERLAEMASSNIQIRLGTLYQRKFLNPIAADKWFKIAAEAGNFESQRNVSSFFATNSNTSTSFVKNFISKPLKRSTSVNLEQTIENERLAMSLLSK